ncbi:MAG: CDC27 family protein, partial [SAR324 cluster bacterium]|nr:CDC27 family protein [SAR324 cluster bacterium]
MKLCRAVFFASFLLLLALPAYTLQAANFAEQLYSEGDYYRAITESKRQIFLGKPDPKLLLIQAKAYFKLGNYREGKRLAQKILQATAGDLEANQILGLTLIRLKELKAAQMHFTKINVEKTWPNITEKNPYLAKNISYFLPGSGLLYTGSPWKA